MIKKISVALFAVFMILCMNFTSFAEEGEEFYDEYDNYDEFQEDYYQSIGIPEQEHEKENEEPWYTGISVIPPAVGLVAGGITVLILYRKHSIARRHMAEHIPPYSLNAKHTVVSDKQDNTL